MLTSRQICFYTAGEVLRNCKLLCRINRENLHLMNFSMFVKFVEMKGFSMVL